MSFSNLNWNDHLPPAYTAPLHAKLSYETPFRNSKLFEDELFQIGCLQTMKKHLETKSKRGTEIRSDLECKIMKTIGMEAIPNPGSISIFPFIHFDDSGQYNISILFDCPPLSPWSLSFKRFCSPDYITLQKEVYNLIRINPVSRMVPSSIQDPLTSCWSLPSKSKTKVTLKKNHPTINLPAVSEDLQNSHNAEPPAKRPVGRPKKDSGKTSKEKRNSSGKKISNAAASRGKMLKTVSFDKVTSKTPAKGPPLRESTTTTTTTTNKRRKSDTIENTIQKENNLIDLSLSSVDEPEYTVMPEQRLYLQNEQSFNQVVKKPGGRPRGRSAKTTSKNPLGYLCDDPTSVSNRGLRSRKSFSCLPETFLSP